MTFISTSTTTNTATTDNNTDNNTDNTGSGIYIPLVEAREVGFLLLPVRYMRISRINSW